MRDGTKPGATALTVRSGASSLANLRVRWCSAALTRRVACVGVGWCATPATEPTFTTRAGVPGLAAARSAGRSARVR